jgi:hypothetical protein
VVNVFQGNLGLSGQSGHFAAIRRRHAMRRSDFLHRHHDHRQRGDEGCDGCECGNITKKVGHRCLPCSLCFLFVLFSSESQQKNKKRIPALHLWLTGRRPTELSSHGTASIIPLADAPPVLLREASKALS